MNNEWYLPVASIAQVLSSSICIKLKCAVVKFCGQLGSGLFELQVIICSPLPCYKMCECHHILQTTPSHIIGQLDKCIREASTLDGVLEFRHEHFWTVAFGMMVRYLTV